MEIRTRSGAISGRGGRIFRFTTHDVDLTVRGDPYRAAQGFDRSAIGSSSDLTGQDAQVRAFFDELGITAEMVAIGALDGARIKIEVVDFTDTTLIGEVFEGTLGTFGGVTDFDAEILSFVHTLEIEQGEVTGPECPYDFGDYRCKKPVNPFDIARSTPYAQQLGASTFGKVLTGLARIEFPLAFDGQGFNEDPLDPAWETLRGSAVTVATVAGLSAIEGARFLVGAGSSPDGYLIRNVVDLATAAVAGGELDSGDVNDFLAAIDGGEATLEVFVYRANTSGDERDSGAVRVDALDADRNPLAVLWDYEAQDLIPRYQLRAFDIISPAGAFVVRSCAGRRIPPDTRQIAVFLEGVTRTGSTCNAAFDGLAIRVVLHGSTVTQAGYENKIYELVTPGTTAAVQPTYDTTPGNTTVDGTTTWICREALTRHATVVTVVSSTVLEVDLDDPLGTEDGRYDNGILFAESGENAIANGARIMSWDGDTQRLTLFLPFPFDFEPGDALVMVVGCRKRFLEDCRDTHDNAINFGGFPMLPGEDEISKAPAILTSGGG